MGIQTTRLDPFPPGENPFLHDACRMGCQIASNCMVMHTTFPDQKATGVVIVNLETGERLFVELTGPQETFSTS